MLQSEQNVCVLKRIEHQRSSFPFLQHVKRVTTDILNNI